MEDTSECKQLTLFLYKSDIVHSTNFDENCFAIAKTRQDGYIKLLNQNDQLKSYVVVQSDLREFDYNLDVFITEEELDIFLGKMTDEEKVKHLWDVMQEYYRFRIYEFPLSRINGLDCVTEPLIKENERLQTTILKNHFTRCTEDVRSYCHKLFGNQELVNHIFKFF